MGKRFLREQRRLDPGSEEPEKRGAEQDAVEHLSHDLRLMESPEDPADAAGRHENDRNLREECFEIEHAGPDLTFRRRSFDGDPLPHIKSSVQHI